MKNQKFIYVFAADSAFTMLRKSLLVNGSFIVSNPLQRETNDSSLNLVKIGFPPCGFGQGFFSLKRRVDSGTVFSTAAEQTDLPEVTAAIAYRIFSNMISYDVNELTLNQAQKYEKSTETLLRKHNRELNETSLGDT